MLKQKISAQHEQILYRYVVILNNSTQLPNITLLFLRLLISKMLGRLDISKSSKIKGNNFEELTKEVFNAITQTKNFKREQPDLTGFSRHGDLLNRQVDVTGSVINKKWQKIVIHIECKNHSSPVNQKEIVYFSASIRKLDPETSLVFVSHKGYQKGAINWAKENEVHLYTLHDSLLEDSDPENPFIRGIHINMIAVSHDYSLICDLDSTEGIKKDCLERIELADSRFCFSYENPIIYICDASG